MFLMAATAEEADQDNISSLGTNPGNDVTTENVVIPVGGDLDNDLSEPLIVGDRIELETGGRETTTSNSEPIDVDEAIDCGPFQALLLIAVGLSYMADSMELGVLAFLPSAIRAEYGMTFMETATMVAVAFSGKFVGSLLLGRLGDKVGRRPIFLFVAVLMSVGGFATAFTVNYVSLIVSRFIVGVGVGGCNVSYDLYDEFLPTKQRRRYLVHLEYFWAIGAILVSWFAYVTLRGDEKGWRIFVMFCSVPSALSALFCYFFVPESPRWLLSKGQNEDALDLLRVVAVINGKDENLIESSAPTEDNDDNNSDDEAQKVSKSTLLLPKGRKVFFLLLVICLCVGFTYYGTVLLMIDSFTSLSGPHLAFEFTPIIVGALGDVLGVMITARVGAGRKTVPLLVIFFLLAGAAVSSIPLMKSDQKLWVTVLTGLARTFEAAGRSKIWLMIGEVLAPEFKTTGHGIFSAFSCIGVALVPYLPLVPSYLPQVNIPPRLMLAYSIGGIHVLAILCSAFLPETQEVVLERSMNDNKNDSEEIGDVKKDDENVEVEENLII